MEEALRVTLVVNAGLLLEYRGVTLLMDGIYGREGHPFSNLTPEVWQQMLNGEGPFRQIDYLLFTHHHPDHFSPSMTLEFLRRRRVKGVFKPAAEGESSLDSWMLENRIPCVSLSHETDRAAYRIEPHITVRAFSTRHLDKKYYGVPHFCYLMEFDDKQVLFTVDTDYTSETFPELSGKNLRAAFVNPLFFHVLNDPRFFSGRLDAEEICVYHVPFAGEDPMGMRRILFRDLEHWPEGGQRAEALSEPFQQLLL